jgi:hypothetical protein
MAFNPLHTLRKHQKVMMAALVFICMVTFILSSGSLGGDFFDWLRYSFTGRMRTTEVATIYGERLDDQEYYRLRQQRLLADQYMRHANAVAHSYVFDQLNRLAEAAKKKTGDDNLARDRAYWEEMRRALERRQPPQDRLYFGGGLSPEEIIDFVIWKRQADRLGIHLTEADARRSRNEEIALKDPPEELLALIGRGLKTRRGERVTPAVLWPALADEFRVRLAKAALLGPEAPPPMQTPFGVERSDGRLHTSFTPHEFWEFYRKSRTDISVRLLPIPVRAFLDEIKEAPTEDELKQLYESHKDTEPNPALPAVGFKQPRRIQVQWVSGSPTEEPYPRLADITLAVAESTMPLWFYERLLSAYSREKFDFRLPSWTEEKYGAALLPAFNQRHFVMVSRLRGLPVDGVTDAVMSAVLGSYQAREVALDQKELGSWVEQETKTRKEFLASALALSATPSPSLIGLAPLGVAVRKHEGDQFGQYLPLNAVKRYLIKNMRQETAQNLLRTNLETLRKELEKHRGRPDDAKKYVAEAVTRFGLKSGGMERPRDMHSLFDDPGMQPLRDPLKDKVRFEIQFLRARELGQLQGFLPLLDDDPKGRLLAQLFFALTTRTFVPDQTFRAEPVYLYWTTVDRAAYVPKFEEVKDQITEAWRLAKARELAKSEADKVAEEAKKAGGDALRRLIDGSKHSAKYIDLYGVTRLKPPGLSPLPGRSQDYARYRIPPTDVEFPTPDFDDKLLEMNDFGDVIVLHDNPQSTYYVATPLAKRTEPLPGEFYAVYNRSALPAPLGDPLIEHFDRARRAEHERAVMEQLRAEAKLRKNEEGIKLVREDERR